MTKVKLAIIYYTTYGTNLKMAMCAKEGAEAAGAEVRVRKCPETVSEEIVQSIDAWRTTAELMANIPEITHADMEWANAYLFSAPTRYGVSASQLRAFIDTCGTLWQAGKLSNKAVSAMTSSMNPHGGQETTLIGLYTTMMHWGAIIVPPGYTHPIQYKAGGNPYGVTITTGGADGGLTSEHEEAIKYQAKRLVEFAGKIAT
ncbi:MAG: NAD(P)H:quinone oxidoreductase type IV [Gemmatimonadaceae bacterium]